MASKFDLNDATPAAPAGRVNIQWQFDATGNVSAHIPSSAASYQTPWLSDIDADGYDLNDLGVVRLRQVTLGELDPASGLAGFANEAGTLHVKTGNGGSIDLESIGNGRVQISTDGVRRIVVHQNGNVGIGPNMNPAYKLEVQGTCLASGLLTASAGVESNLYRSAADMVFQVGAGFPERVRIKAATGHSAFTGNLEIDPEHGYCGNLTHDGTNWRYRAAGSGFIFYPTSNAFILYGAVTGASGGLATLVERIRFRDDDEAVFSGSVRHGNITMTQPYIFNTGENLAFYKKQDVAGTTGFIFRRSPTGGITDALDLFMITDFGRLKIYYLPSSNPGAGSKELYYDPADGNTVKYAP